MTRDRRELVATGNRLLYLEGLATSSGHVSAIDRDAEVVYVNPFDTPRGEMRPDTVVEATLENEPIDPAAPDPVDEIEIHTAVYRNRDDVGAVVHVHPPIATLFGIAGRELRPVHIRGSVLDGPVPVLDRPDKITERQEGDAMVEAMGDANQLLLRGHGAVIADRDVQSAVIRAIVIEENARYQLWASVLGEPIAFTEAEADRVRAQNWKRSSIEKRWQFYSWKARKQGLLPFE